VPQPAYYLHFRVTSGALGCHPRPCDRGMELQTLRSRGSSCVADVVDGHMSELEAGGATGGGAEAASGGSPLKIRARPSMPDLEEGDTDRLTSKSISKDQLHLRVALGSVGNVLEWADFAIFGYFAVEIGAAFFPDGDPAAQACAPT